MANQADFEQDTPGREYRNPHNAKHPIPTIQGYRQHRRELADQLEDEEQAQRGPEDVSRPKRAFESAKAAIRGQDIPKSSRHDPYPSTNHNYANDTQYKSEEAVGSHSEGSTEETVDDEGNKNADKNQDDGNKKKGEQDKSGTEAVASAVDPKEKRKAMKKARRHGEGREVTDPVTHLSIIIHDQTEKDLKSVPQNLPEPGLHHDTATGPQGASKSDEELRLEREKLQRTYNGMQRVFPPPDFEHTKKELASVYQRTVYAGLTAIGSLAAVLLPAPAIIANSSRWVLLNTGLFVLLGAATVVGMGKWVSKKTSEVFEDETWSAARREEQAILSNNEELPESTQWLNSLLSSIWPLVNPDLFASLVDQIEDIMQASLPKVIKMVSVDDMGQGSEAIRILGVRWLPTGAASQTVSSDGEIRGDHKSTGSDRTDPQNPQGNTDSQESDAEETSERKNEGKDPKQEEQEQVSVKEGMEAEEGDFVNMELALAYRSRSSGDSLKAKAKNAHLYLKFYLPGGVAVPVWVELRGLIMTVRLRLQLTPDPPFISLCTMTFLGQPKASISCVPLSKHLSSLTDIPLISSFVNSAIDAALAEYVAPKSLTLNLKDMLVGEDFKKDTASLGVVWIFIKQARGFKQGDGGIGPMEGSSDSYVTVAWGKFGKPVASTRIVTDDDEPNWHEWATILVTPEEVNAEEKLRLQLWDSDKWSADDDLGRVEVDLKRLMKSPNRIYDREDRFVGQDSDEPMPGSIVWSVGYFSKMRITSKELEQQTVNEEIRTHDQLKRHVSEISEHKLREAGKASDDEELKQQKAQDYREIEESMIISAPPSTDLVSGILSVQIHNITGLEVQKLQKDDKGEGGDDEDEAEQHDDMPDSYCTIILNHKKIYRTRTKPKNSKPFFNAGTERFVRDWRDTEIIVSVRDSREREDDPLIGIVYLPLAKVFAKKSQMVENLPLVGGIGFGRVRISMVWRSVEIKLPPNLRGWDYGTLEICGPIRAKEGLPKSLTEHRIKLRTNIGRAKMYPESGQWVCKSRKENEAVFLAVRKRYASAMVIEFRESILGRDKTAAFAVLWLHDLVDEENDTRPLKVWKGSKDGLQKARSCCDYNGLGEGEQPLGEIELDLKFWRGLSGYHKSYASQAKNNDLRDVMECLDTITDEKLDDDEDESGDEADMESDDDSENEETRKKLRVHTNDDSSRSSSDDEDGAQGSSSSSSLSLRDFKKVKNIFHNPVGGAAEVATAVVAPGHNDPDDGSRGVRNQLRDYKDHHKQLHRKHRGIMQFRPAREASHLGSKLSRLKGNIGGMFHHDEKETGVETEV
ncbi:uncharacterized protein F4807DRAFT_439492 [Annulohypoxylon truncatum]|uniref:uncharacterized protein n=1 Tax=Annulohypoxylon truncatum TaxID=327061 RepID=UPI002007902A|nr:uncharacterized protein F4807DRAFT_439492 [Annulohypoxylon truncatum]KAI1206265.1 hypothetical protein F4807DRAFT_439492 [Annulohypoxylon truncatum]